MQVVRAKVLIGSIIGLVSGLFLGSLASEEASPSNQRAQEFMKLYMAADPFGVSGLPPDLTGTLESMAPTWAWYYDSCTGVIEREHLAMCTQIQEVIALKRIEVLLSAQIRLMKKANK